MNVSSCRNLININRPSQMTKENKEIMIRNLFNYNQQ